MVIGPAGNLVFFGALGFAPQIYFTTAGGGLLSIVMNSVFAHFILKEAFSRHDALLLH